MIVAVGNTGCGKSTMLSSIIYGPDSLYEKKFTEKIKTGGNKFKEIQRAVIDLKNPQQGFKIGHSAAKSMTFLPQF